jgi:methyl-accepting chemotaxis protein PixJ
MTHLKDSPKTTVHQKSLDFSGGKFFPSQPEETSPSLAVKTSSLKKPKPTAQEGRSILQRFYDLPIRQKTQLIPLLVFLSLGGVVGLGTATLVGSLRNQSLNQAKAQLSVAQINYNSKIQDMASRLQSQADNPTILAALQSQATGQGAQALQNQVKAILGNIRRLGKIEYATLVGKDLRIIANANANRRGETFDPNQLVSEAFLLRKPITSSERISWEELSRESPPLPQGFSRQAALIRYTIIPVKDPKTRSVIGALVGADIANGELPIVKKTVETALSLGYSAVYLREADGKFSLATSFEKTGPLGAKINVPLSQSSLLEEAVSAGGDAVARRSSVGNHTYALAAKALLNSAGEEVGILLYGDPEITVGQILQNSLLVQLGLSGAVLAVIGLLALVLRQAIAQPVQELQQAAQNFSQGDYQKRAKVFSRDEIGQLAGTFNQMAGSIESNEQLLRLDSQQASLLAEISGGAILSEQDLERVFERTLAGARELLNLQRMVIYRLTREGRDYILSESVAEGWTSSLAQQIEDGCLPADLLDAYSKGRVVVEGNILTAELHLAHRQLLERLEVKANLIVPILNQGELFGLLIAHHCAAPHQWQEREVLFLRQLALQLGLTLDRVTLLKQREAEAKWSKSLKEITLQIAQSLNPQEIFETVVAEVKAALAAQRVIVYNFDRNWQGTVVAEAVAAPMSPALGAEIADPCFAEKYAQKYQQGRVMAMANIDQAGLTDCHRRQLEQFQVKANLIAPILVGDGLLGLLIAHQATPRTWEKAEIDFFTQVAIQVGLAVNFATQIDQQRVPKEQLQRRALELLMEVDPVREGDLTIRAQVTDDEIGTIADSYNATIESLRRIVLQVQAASQQVTDTTSQNELSVQGLAAEAQRQVGEITTALERLETMGESIRAVASNAQAAEAAMQQAGQTVRTGEVAMNRTVEGILELRETVTETAQKMQRLGESSQKISKIVSLIGRFAAQTHLLALKASIEAARSGEEGRGFAVIADEVRALAAQSAEATAEIETLVGTIQAETQQVVSAMQAGTQQALTGTKLVEETRQSLNQIVAASTQIDRLVEAIAQATVEQSQASTTVTQTMVEVAGIAQQTSQSATQVSTSFRQLLAVAQELQEGVGQFKL